ncbi:MAG: insulinase family protein [Myxococcales bacterium]|nr:insulinase family protein [Myxococcales bacterium]
MWTTASRRPCEAFSTRNHPGGSLIGSLRSKGLHLGYHLNANTTFDHTRYWLTVHTSQLDLGIVVLSDWAGGMLFEPDEVERERGVVLEEWRRRQAAWRRAETDRHVQTLAGSPFAARRPIGTRQSLETFELNEAKRFYDTHYDPARMSVIAVGDLDEEQVVDWIEAAFGELPARRRDPARRVTAPYETPGGRVRLLEEPGLSSVRGMLAWTWSGPVWTPTHGNARDRVVRYVAERIFRDRLTELMFRGDVRSAWLDEYVYASDLEVQRVGFEAAPDEALATLDTMWTEVRRLSRVGVRDDELVRAREGLSSWYRTIGDPRYRSSPRAIADELVRHAVHGEFVTGTAYESAMALEMLRTVRRDEVDAVFRRWFTPDDRLVHLAGPPGSLPDENAVHVALQGLDEAALTQWGSPPRDISTDPLDATSWLPDRKGDVVERDLVSGIGLHRLELSNGMVVWWKPTSSDSVQLLGVAGRVRSPRELAADRLAVEVASRSGVRWWSEATLQRLLDGQSIRMEPFADGTHVGVRGSAPGSSLNTLLQLAYLHLQRPRFDPDVLTEAAAALREEAIGGPDKWVDRLMDGLRGIPDEVPPPEMDLREVELRVRKMFDDRAFEFVLVGSLPRIDILERLLSTTVGALPRASGPMRSGQMLEPLPPELTEIRHLVEGVEAATVILVLHGLEVEPGQTNALKVLAEILDERLMKRIREALGGTYVTDVRAVIPPIPGAAAELHVQFECDPRRADELRRAAREVIAALQADDLVERGFSDMERRIALRRSSRAWARQLATARLRGEDPGDWDGHVDPPSLEALADQLDTNRTVEIVLLPARSH